MMSLPRYTFTTFVSAPSRIVHTLTSSSCPSTCSLFRRELGSSRLLSSDAKSNSSSTPLGSERKLEGSVTSSRGQNPLSFIPSLKEKREMQIQSNHKQWVDMLRRYGFSIHEIDEIHRKQLRSGFGYRGPDIAEQKLLLLRTYAGAETNRILLKRPNLLAGTLETLSRNFEFLEDKLRMEKSLICELLDRGTPNFDIHMEAVFDELVKRMPEYFDESQSHMSQDEINRIFVRFPALLRVKPDTVKRQFSFLVDECGLSSELAFRTVCKNQTSYGLSFDRMKHTAEMLLKIYSKEEFATMIRLLPELLHANVETRFPAAVSAVESLGFTAEDARRLIFYQPGILSFNDNLLLRKLRFYLNTYDHMHPREVFDMLCSMNSKALMVSLEKRISLRFAFLKSLGYSVTSFKLATILHYSEESFVKMVAKTSPDVYYAFKESFVYVE